MTGSNGSGPSIEFKVHFRNGAKGRRHLKTGVSATPVDPGRVPRVARLLALAHRCDELVRDGGVTGYAELARLCHVSRARVTQILNLLNLAPDIQEEILQLPKTIAGEDPVSERRLRAIATEVDWAAQRERWRKLKLTLTENVHTDDSRNME